MRPARLPARTFRTRHRSVIRSAPRPSPRARTPAPSRSPRSLDAVLTIANATVQVSPGATAEELVFTLTNTGNGTETFNLTALTAGVVGDDFDPTLASPAIYFDTDNSGDFSGGDLAYNAGVNDPVAGRGRQRPPHRRQQHPEHGRQRQSRPQPADCCSGDRHRRTGHQLRPDGRRRCRGSGRHDRRRRLAVRRIPRRGRAAHSSEDADDRRPVRRRDDRCLARASTTRSS